jgi:hypothetical protein
MSPKVKAIALAAALCAFVAPVFAASEATLNLSGTVSKSASISISASSATLDLTTTQTNKVVTTLTAVSNAGYTITISSLYGGVLKGANSGETVAYSLVVDNGTGVSLSSSTTLTASAKTSSAGTSYALGVAYTGSAVLTPDTYSDSITISIAAN